MYQSTDQSDDIIVSGLAGLSKNRIFSAGTPDEPANQLIDVGRTSLRKSHLTDVASRISLEKSTV